MPVLRHLVPRTLRAWLITGAAALLAVGGAGFLVLWFAVFDTSSPPPLELGATTASPGATAVASGDLAGQWNVGNGSVVGYRVREQLAFLSAPSDAVGRTSQVAGSATLSGSAGALTLNAAAFKADVTSLSSDRRQRDQRIHSIGLQSDRFPTATFTLSQPVSLPANATTGATLSLDLVGDLGLHGATKRVTIPVQAHLSGGVIEVVGSLTFPWGDFGMTAPSIGGIVSVTDRATLEFDLHLQHG
jgi:polyisoprenoid-binding protein YceI